MASRKSTPIHPDHDKAIKAYKRSVNALRAEIVKLAQDETDIQLRRRAALEQLDTESRADPAVRYEAGLGYVRGRKVMA